MYQNGLDAHLIRIQTSTCLSRYPSYDNSKQEQARNSPQKTARKRRSGKVQQSPKPLVHRNQCDFCDLRLRCIPRTPTKNKEGIPCKRKKARKSDKKSKEKKIRFAPPICRLPMFCAKRFAHFGRKVGAFRVTSFFFVERGNTPRVRISTASIL